VTFTLENANPAVTAIATGSAAQALGSLFSTILSPFETINYRSLGKVSWKGEQTEIGPTLSDR
jgi:hypothetical protein